jgi:hypothetical protein
VTSASLTLQTLADAIVAAGGPRYSFVDNTFITDDETGGEPGGNIRTVFLYREDRVDLVEGSVRTVTDPADQATDPNSPFADSRLPLVADFAFSGETVTVVTNHFTSKGGSAPLLGAVQPPTNGGEDRRLAQAEAVNGFVDGLLRADSSTNVVVLGDLNEFEFEEPIRALEGADGALLNLTNTLSENERYSYVFEGNSQSLDHILASPNLAAVARFDAVHVNSEFAGNASDHDPLLARFDVAGRALSGGNGADGWRAGASPTRSPAAPATTLSGGGGADSLAGGNGDLLRGGSGRTASRAGTGTTRSRASRGRRAGGRQRRQPLRFRAGRRGRHRARLPRRRPPGPFRRLGPGSDGGADANGDGALDTVVVFSDADRPRCWAWSMRGVVRVSRTAPDGRRAATGRRARRRATSGGASRPRPAATRGRATRPPRRDRRHTASMAASAASWRATGGRAGDGRGRPSLPRAAPPRIAEGPGVFPPGPSH